MMKLKVQQVFDATLTLSQIIRDQNGVPRADGSAAVPRPMSQKGKYRIARLHAKLLPEYTVANERRDAMIKAYGYHPPVPAAGDEGAKAMVPSPEFGVPDDKLAEFNAAWKEIAEQEIDLDVEPIPLAMLDLGDTTDGSIQAAELILLGDLVAG